ncbi:helix-turn-helix transcriptional regulator [Radiobacillus sp. PE A8.2]|uniref:helix-turn-helix transcriptional regulator n=1 Tax=Radiobacillus sp. PE A8.2 TaxID=3380349 RepID=UPI00388EC0E7
MEQQLSTRQSILELLKKNRSFSVSELRTHLDITEMAIRKHLFKLEGERLINSRTVRQPMGRPVIYYSLSPTGEKLFPANYGTIMVDFLSDIEEMNGQEAIDTLFKNRQKRLEKQYGRRIDFDSGLEEKVNELVHLQNESGYMAEYSVRNQEEIEFSQYNCPIASISKKYNQPCDCEMSLLKKVLDTDNVERLSCLTEGDNCCKYVVKQEQGEAQESHS